MSMAGPVLRSIIRVMTILLCATEIYQTRSLKTKKKLWEIEAALRVINGTPGLEEVTIKSTGDVNNPKTTDLELRLRGDGNFTTGQTHLIKDITDKICVPNDLVIIKREGMKFDKEDHNKIDSGQRIELAVWLWNLRDQKPDPRVGKIDKSNVTLIEAKELKRKAENEEIAAENIDHDIVSAKKSQTNTNEITEARMLNTASNTKNTVNETFEGIGATFSKNREVIKAKTVSSNVANVSDT